MPVKVVSLCENKRAIVDLGGIQREISMALVDDVSIGDYVVLHVGYALTRLDEVEAKKTLKLFDEMLSRDPT